MLHLCSSIDQLYLNICIILYILHERNISSGELVTLLSFSLSLQTQGAETSTITAWWWFKPGSAFTPTTQTSAVPLVHVPRKHTPAPLKNTASAGDAVTTS